MFIKDKTSEREALAPLLGQAVMVSGTVSAVDMPSPNQRRFCFSHPEIAPLFDERFFAYRDGVQPAHIWVKINKIEHAELWENYKARIYESYRFPARVVQYQRQDGSFAYGIQVDPELDYPSADAIIAKANNALNRVIAGDLSLDRKALLCREISSAALEIIDSEIQFTCYLESIQAFRERVANLLTSIRGTITFTDNRDGRRRKRLSQLKRSSKRPTAAGFA